MSKKKNLSVAKQKVAKLQPSFMTNTKGGDITVPLTMGCLPTRYRNCTLLTDVKK